MRFPFARKLFGFLREGYKKGFGVGQRLRGVYKAYVEPISTETLNPKPENLAQYPDIKAWFWSLSSSGPCFVFNSPSLIPKA